MIRNRYFFLCLNCVLAGLNLFLLLAVLWTTFQSGFDADEVEHAHVTWALGEGIMPYRNIHQIHMPVLWIGFSPVFQAMPNSVYTLLTARAVCLLAFVGTYLVGLGILREVLGRLKVTQGLMMLMLCLSVLVATELYRFRPDPFMTFFSACALLGALRFWHKPLLYSAVSGLAVGLAASFSPKMVPFCFLMPIICIYKAIVDRSLKPLWFVIAHGAGFLTGVIPMAAWLVWHGLLKEFATWSIVRNVQMVNLGMLVLIRSLVAAVRGIAGFAVLAAIGASILATRKRGSLDVSKHVAFSLITSACLAFLVALLDPNKYTYNWQIFVIPGAVLGTVALTALLQSNKSLPVKALVVSLALVTLCAPLTRALKVGAAGIKISQGELRRLIELTREDGTTCLGMAPYHPIFCRDAANLYLYWDLGFLSMEWVPEEAKPPYRALLAEALSSIERGEPDIISSIELWELGHESGAVSDVEFRRILQATAARYDVVSLGEKRIWMRR